MHAMAQICFYYDCRSVLLQGERQHCFATTVNERYGDAGAVASVRHTSETGMADAFIYDHVRTPRGRGKPDGSLHGIMPIQLVAQALQAVRDRNLLDTRLLDDVVLGCVAPLGEQGANIARCLLYTSDAADE